MLVASDIQSSADLSSILPVITRTIQIATAKAGADILLIDWPSKGRT